MILAWRRHGMGAICGGTGHLCGEFAGHRWIPHKRPVTQSLGVFFDLRLNKLLSKQSWGWWFKMPSRPLWHRCNEKIWKLSEQFSSLHNFVRVPGCYAEAVCEMTKQNKKSSFAHRKSIYCRALCCVHKDSMFNKAGMAIPMLKIRRPNGRLIFNMEIAIRR